MSRNPWLTLLSSLVELLIVVMAGLNFNDDRVFAKLVAVLVLLALWDIERAVKDR